MTLDERYDIAAELMQRMSTLAQTLDQVLPIYADSLRHMQDGSGCMACNVCPLTEAANRAPEGIGSFADNTLAQWQRMMDDMTQLRAMLRRACNSAPVIGVIDCTR